MVHRLLLIAFGLTITGFKLTPAIGAEPLDVGDRLELMADHLVSKLTNARLVVQQPTPKEVVLVTDKPWEGNICAYYTIFRDGKKYRMYYRGSHYDTKTKKSAHTEVVCYAESKDGIRWTRPDLGLFEFNGSKKNNIVWDGIGAHCFAAFKDANPNCKPEAKYKAISRGRPRGKKGLYTFQSPDGIHWTQSSKGPVITYGAFDSQNLAFWDPVRKIYVAYYRNFRNRVRDIMTCTSKDFVHWSKPVYLKISGAPREHLYTNAIQPYERAPHLKIGFPTRYLPKGSQVAPTYMISRDGLNFRRYKEPVVPNDAPKDREGNRSNYMTWGLVQLPGRPNHYSVYATEAYYTGPDSRVRRFEYRLDGFIAATAGAKGGEVHTIPLKFKGDTLTLNYRTARSGSIRVEILDDSGKPIPGFTLSDCSPIKGDSVKGAVQWKGGKSLKSLAGNTVRVRFALKSAQVFSMRFGG